MDPILKLEVDAFLVDLWAGTDIELALAKAKLVLTRERGDADIDHAINHALGIVLDVARSEAEPMKASFDKKSVQAIAIDNLEQIIDEWDEGD